MSGPVAYLINVYPAASHTFIRREIRALERQGVRVLRIAMRGWAPQSQLVDEEDRAEAALTRYVLAGGGLPLLLATVRTLIGRPLKFLAAAGLALRMARDSHRPVAVHLVYLAEACLIRGWLAKARAAHLHAHFATNPAEVAMLVNALGGPPYSFTAHGSDIADRPAQIGLRETVGRARFVATVCSYGLSQIMRWVPPGSWSKLHVVRCGLEPGYGEGDAPEGPSTGTLLCVGRLASEKGQLLLVKAAAQLARRGVAFRLVLAGDGPMRADIESLVERHGLAGKVQLTGWLDSRSIERALSGARALVVPSLSEGLPVAIMEAMAHRRPVIAPFLAGIPELVGHGVSGWLYPAGDVAALTDAMQQCLEACPVETRRMGEAAYAAVWRMHNADIEAGKLRELIENPARASRAAEGS